MQFPNSKLFRAPRIAGQQETSVRGIGQFLASWKVRDELPRSIKCGLSYMHSGMYGMYALQESVRQMRGTAPAQIPDAKISVCHGVGGMFAASGTIIMSNEVPRD